MAKIKIKTLGKRKLLQLRRQLLARNRGLPELNSTENNNNNVPLEIISTEQREPVLTLLTNVEMEIVPLVKKSPDQRYEDANNTSGLELHERRICDLKYFFENLKSIAQHNKAFDCGIHNLEIVGEQRKGLNSILKFKCNMCNQDLFSNTTDPSPDSYVNLNESLLSAAITTGVGFSQLEEIFSSLNIAFLSRKLFGKISQNISEEWYKLSTDEMEAAAKFEWQCAINEDRVTEDGIPVIDVVTDGCWSKRSYKTNYSALSGAAAIIGKRSGKVLYLGVKNKYCVVCARAENKKIEAKDHKCFKNFSGSSTSMESDILVEGFKQSIAMYGLIYGRMIADGDSSTYNKIIQARPYTNYTVEKIECRNHLLRNMCNKMQAVTKDTKFSLKDRKLITTGRILAIRKVICSAIKHLKNKNIEHTKKISGLYDVIINSYYHAFGDHDKCVSFYCESKKCSENLTLKLRGTALENRLHFIIHQIAAHSRSLIEDFDSNTCETFNSIIAKCIGGKRINFSLKNSYKTRCDAAVVTFNNRTPLYSIQKQLLKKSPQTLIKKKELSKIKCNFKRKGNAKITRKRLHFEEISHKDYGSNCQKPDLSVEDFERVKKSFLEKLKKSDYEINKIEQETVHQSDSSEWLETRRNLLTASNFAKVINRRVTTKAAGLVKQLLYSKDISMVPSIRHGKENERLAVAQLEEQQCIKIKRCGLFIEKENPFLGATPDGVIDNDKIVEIKCPFSAYNISFEDAVKKRKITFYKFMNGELIVNKKHSWYYQIQGQLNISKRKECLLGIWLGPERPMKVETIKTDKKLWEKLMVPKLREFYFGAILPELLDPRQSRNMPLRDLIVQHPY